jgi:excisionase family DNA binding protein
MKKGIHSIDDDIFQKIKQRWYNGRWHYAQMLTVQDVALALHLSRNTVYRLLHFKKIRSVKINNQYFISKRHLVDFEKKVKVRERRSL